ncbi:MAG: hypothetical protein L6R39_002623 [Caloplaca ligustica]|nr:MAG: hypothetical protein L6R39_002623 [Caloplaca ligustica]
MLPQLILFLSFHVSTLLCHPAPQALELGFAHEPHVATGPEPGHSTLGRREVEVSSAKDSSLDADGADYSDLALERRDTSPPDENALLALEQADKRCAAQLKDKRSLARPLALEKRVDIPAQSPSNILFDAPAQCLIVGFTDAQYLPFVGQTRNVIGTTGLCGCIAVAIVGESGAVIAHLATRLDMTAQFNRLLASFGAMHGQRDITAYVFVPNQGPAITGAMAAAVGQISIQLRDFIIDNMGVPIVSRGYDAGAQTQGNARVGTLMAAVVGGVVRLWINNRLANN